MEPASLALGIVGLASMAKQVTDFIGNARDAKGDLQATSREVQALGSVIRDLKGALIKHDVENAVDRFGALPEHITLLVGNCQDVLHDILHVLEKHIRSWVGANLKYASKGRSTLKKHRISLSAHMLALNLSIQLVNVHMSYAIKNDTEEILCRLKDLRQQPRRDSHKNIMLNKYLDGLTTYAETMVGEDEEDNENSEDSEDSEEDEEATLVDIQESVKPNYKNDLLDSQLAEEPAGRQAFNVQGWDSIPAARGRDQYKDSQRFANTSRRLDSHRTSARQDLDIGEQTDRFAAVRLSDENLPSKARNGPRSNPSTFRDSQQSTPFSTSSSTTNPQPCSHVSHANGLSPQYISYQGTAPGKTLQHITFRQFRATSFSEDFMQVVQEGFEPEYRRSLPSNHQFKLMLAVTPFDLCRNGEFDPSKDAFDHKALKDFLEEILIDRKIVESSELLLVSYQFVPSYCLRDYLSLVGVRGSLPDGAACTLIESRISNTARNNHYEVPYLELLHHDSNQICGPIEAHKQLSELSGASCVIWSPSIQHMVWTKKDIYNALRNAKFLGRQECEWHYVRAPRNFKYGRWPELYRYYGGLETRKPSNSVMPAAGNRV